MYTNGHLNTYQTNRCVAPRAILTDLEEDYRIIKSPKLANYGVLNLNYINVIEPTVEYLDWANKFVLYNLIRKKDSIYNFQTNRLLSQYNFEIIKNKIGLIICDLFEQSDKTIEMIDNYGIIYSNTTNLSTGKHNFDCDIIINICLENLLPINDGIMCFYSSKPSKFSKDKNNIRITFGGIEQGDIFIHRGSHETQVFPINCTNSDQYRTHLIIKCNFV